MILKIILFLLIAFSCYLLIDVFLSQNLKQKVARYLKYKNEKYAEERLKYYEKKKKVKINSRKNLYHRLLVLIEQAGYKVTLLLNPVTIILLGILIFLLSYVIVFKVFKIFLLTFFITIPTIFIPVVILNWIAEIKKKKIEKVILNFLLQIKNYTQINNDIIYALKEVKTIEPLQSYIKKFLVEMNSGVKFEKAIENLKEKIMIQRFQAVFTNIQYCYLHGGNFAELMTKNYKMISDIQKEKNRREQETMGARIVLMILILLDLFVYFTFIKDNYENYKIMTRSVLGNIILYWNFISIWFLVLIMNKVKKLDY